MKHEEKIQDDIEVAEVTHATLSTEMDVLAFDENEDNPREWPKHRRWSVTIIVSLYSFATLAASTLIAPALPAIADDLHIAGSAETQMTMSAFILAAAVGPLLWGPLSEIYGRVIILQISNLIFIVFNTVCAISRNEAGLVVARLLSGFGASATFALLGGVLSDCWYKEERGKGIALVNFVPLLAPALGPLAAAAILGRLSWRWVFGITSLFDVLVALVGLLFLHESYQPVIRQRRAKRLRKGRENQDLSISHNDPDRKTLKIVRTTISRAVLLLAREPLIWMISVYNTCNFGVLYLFLSTFPSLWIDVYHESITISGLHYLAYGLGLFVGTQLGARVGDHIYNRLKASHNQQGRAEFRLPPVGPFALLLPTSLLFYGWTAQYHLHWMWPTAASFLLAIAYVAQTQMITAYTIECYPDCAASATAAATVTRNISAFAFPLFGPTLYAKLGWGLGNSVLAFLLLVVAVPMPLLLWKLGKGLRNTSGYAGEEMDAGRA